MLFFINFKLIIFFFFFNWNFLIKHNITFIKDIATNVVEPELGITNNWYYEKYTIIVKDANDILSSVYNYNLNPKYFNVNYYYFDYIILNK